MERLAMTKRWLALCDVLERVGYGPKEAGAIAYRTLCVPEPEDAVDYNLDPCRYVDVLDINRGEFDTTIHNHCEEVL